METESFIPNKEFLYFLGFVSVCCTAKALLGYYFMFFFVYIGNTLSWLIDGRAFKTDIC